jgi:antitoxin component YwqK of YwqJK toxin-antitoxin module
VERYHNGAIYRETDYRHGVPDGERKEYALNGRVKARGRYRNGQLDGLQEGWFEEGPKRFERHYKRGRLDGVQTEWHIGGSLFREETFADGKEIAKKILFSDGRLFTNYAMRENRIYGIDGGALCMEPKREGASGKR